VEMRASPQSLIPWVGITGHLNASGMPIWRERFWFD
jgi:hypothetical protein